MFRVDLANCLVIREKEVRLEATGTDLSGIQTTHLILILIFGTFMGLIFVFAPNKIGALKIFFLIAGSSVVFMAFGLTFACLAGKNCMDVLILEDTGGFGRAYAGAG